MAMGRFIHLVWTKAADMRKVMDELFEKWKVYVVKRGYDPVTIIYVMLYRTTL